MTPWCAATVAPVRGEMSAWARPRRGAGPAHVAPRAACSMRKAAGCTVGGDADDFNAFALGRRAGGDGDVAPGNLESIGEEHDQLGIGRTIDRRRIDPDEQGAIAGPCHFRCAPPRYPP